MSEHTCDKALTLEQHGKDIGALFEGKNDLTGRITEMETTLYGAERNGGGFIRESKETMEVVRLSVVTMADQVKGLVDKRSGVRAILLAAIPSLIMGAVTIATLLLTRGAP